MLFVIDGVFGGCGPEREVEGCLLRGAEEELDALACGAGYEFQIRPTGA